MQTESSGPGEGRGGNSFNNCPLQDKKVAVLCFQRINKVFNFLSKVFTTLGFIAVLVGSSC